MPDEKLEAIEEILHRSKDLDKAIKEIRKELKLRKFTLEDKEDDLIIVDDEDDLIKKLKEGYEIVKELKDGRVILRK